MLVSNLLSLPFEFVVLRVGMDRIRSGKILELQLQKVGEIKVAESELLSCSDSWLVVHFGIVQ